jgi:hypothetical protein
MQPIPILFNNKSISFLTCVHSTAVVIGKEHFSSIDTTGTSRCASSAVTSMPRNHHRYPPAISLVDISLASLPSISLSYYSPSQFDSWLGLESNDEEEAATTSAASSQELTVDANMREMVNKPSSLVTWKSHFFYHCPYICLVSLNQSRLQAPLDSL